MSGASAEAFVELLSYKERKEVAADLKLIYTAAPPEEAENRLLEFTEKRETRYPVVARSWSANWARIVPMFAFTPEIRRAIYTTNAKSARHNIVRFFVFPLL